MTIRALGYVLGIWVGSIYVLYRAFLHKNDERETKKRIFCGNKTKQ